MITNAEKLVLDSFISSANIGGVAATVGNTLTTSSLKSYKTLTTNVNASVYYNAAQNEVIVKGNGAVLSGYNFSGTHIVVDANNVTIQNSTFDDKAGWQTILQNKGFTGMTVKNNTFNGGDNNNLSMFVLSEDGYANVSNNKFLNAPSHDVQISNGVVSNNYISGGGYCTGAHADAIAVLSTTGPVMISGNYIDWTANAGQTGISSNDIRITTEMGNTSNVTVENNVLLGGQYSVSADSGDGGDIGSFSNVTIANNYIGDFIDGALYPTLSNGATASGNIIVDYSNPMFSSQAWAAYQAQGIGTTHLLAATAAGQSITGATTGSSTLYGDGAAVYLFGTANETNFVGGFGTQYIWGGSGKNIYTYLSVGDSTQTGGEDSIGNFHTSQDVIDLSHIDANLGQAGVQNFNFIGTAALTSAGGQVDVVHNAALNETLVEVSLVGDAQPDMVIRLSGLLNLTAANFALNATQSASAIGLTASLAARN